MMKTNIANLSILTAGILTSQLAIAGTTMEGTGKEMKAPMEKIKESCISGDIGVNVVSQYVTRGVILENQGAIIQPFADLYFKLYEGEGFINKVVLNLGIWNSFHSAKTDAGVASGSGASTTRSWYEFDFTPGVSITFAKNFTFTPSYYMFLSPNDGFSTFHGLNLKLAFDDAPFLGKFALHPTAQVLFELENKAGTGADEGVYYEIAIAPGFPLGPVAISFPIAAGFGSSDFYGSLDTASGTIQNEEFGFVSGGVNVSYAIAAIPECYGSWTVNAGATYFHLGDGTSDFNTPQRGGAVRGVDAEENEWVFQGGLIVTF